MTNLPVNEGIKSIQEKGSGIFREGAHMMPSVSLMLAENVLKSVKDLKKPFVTIINSYTTQIPGHAHLNVLGEIVKKELEGSGVNVWYTNIGGAICDGIAMGHFGMKYSLPSRELIADQIETIIGAHPCDAWIGIGNCDKIIPAMYNAMVRVNIPSIYVSGGPMLSGNNNSDLISVFEGVGEYSAGKISKNKLDQILENIKKFPCKLIPDKEEKYISKCIESLLNQTKKADEIVLIVHNSSDNTLQIANKYPIKIIPFNGQEGITYARIEGLKNIVGDIVLCIDGDSYAKENWIEVMTKTLRNGNILVGSWIKIKGTLFGNTTNIFDKYLCIFNTKNKG